MFVLSPKKTGKKKKFLIRGLESNFGVLNFIISTQNGH